MALVMALAPRLVLVDGSAIFFRAYYAIPGNLRTSSGLPTNAIYGFATMFRKLFQGRTPDKGAVVFDAPGPTFRTSQYSEYKANRESPPEDLIRQRSSVDRIVEAYGFTILRVKGYEADDVIGTLAERASRAGMEVSIVSADKDFVQLLRPNVKMFDPFTGAGTTYDVERATQKWGIPPDKFVDFLALLGDKIDNIPGVPGIGKKGASDLLDAYGDLEGVLSNVDKLKGRQRTALETHADSARLSQKLARIVTDVPVPVALEDLDLPALDEKNLNKLYKELEFYSLLTEEDLSAEEAQASTCKIVDATSLAEYLKKWSSPIAVEPIWDSPSVAPDALVGLCLSGETDQAVYIDLRTSVPDVLVSWLTDPNAQKITHETKLLFVMFGSRGLLVNGVVADLQLASFLIDPNKLIPHRLDQISREYLQRPLPPSKRLLGSGKKELRFRDLEPQKIADWAGQRATTILEAWPKVSEALKHEGQERHLYEVDLPLSRVLSEMERDGIGVDTHELETIENEFVTRLRDLESRIFQLAGREFNIRSTKQLAQILFEDLKLPIIKRTKTGYSTNAEVLERLAPKYPIAEQLLEQRKLEKLINTYTRVLREAVRADTQRVHATFQQTAGVTGRLISTDPDLQRTPIKTPEGERIRRAFVASPGRKIVSADWSQIELRLLAHVSQDPQLLESFRNEQDIHTRTASELFETPAEDISKDQRRIGKTVNFATVYGQGATALGQILKIPQKEAQAYINGYFKAYAGVKTWRAQIIEEAKKKGYVETLFGRRRYIPELSSNATMERAGGERIAVNTPIQGSAADICKAAMLKIASTLAEQQLKSRMILQIHDELLFECPEDEVQAVSDIARTLMASIVELSVPLITDVGVGQSWAEAH